MCTRNIDGGQAEGIMCGDPGARTTSDTSGSLFVNLVFIESTSKLFACKLFLLDYRYRFGKFLAVWTLDIVFLISVQIFIM